MQTQGRRTVATPGTAVALSAGTEKGFAVMVQAFASNSDLVAVGFAGVVAAAGTETGVLLAPGETLSMNYDRSAPGAILNDVFIDARVVGEGVSYLVH